MPNEQPSVAPCTSPTADARSHVLLTFEDYRKLAANHPRITELLAEPAGVEDVEFVTAVARRAAEPAHFA